jgi:putative PIG3 family NAD(P)H quinone oxidoreductase
VRAIVLSSYGDADVLVPADVDDPVVGPGEVLLDVVATAVNRADVMQRRGSYPPPPGASPYLGLECSGRIAELGEGVTGWSVGDAVCALLSGGGYATRVAVPAGQLLPVPAGLTLEQAAALPEVACTVWSNVFSLAGLRAGEVLLVHGGTSGIGTMAVQLAARAGARVLCTVGSAEKASRAVELGAERAVLYRDEDFVAVVREVTGGAGADVVLDNMGAAYLPRNVEVLAVGGRLVVIGLQGGTRGELDLGALLAKRATVHATSLRARPPAEKAAIVAAVRQHVWPAVEAGQVRPVVDRVLPLDEAAQAHRVLESSAHIGKIVLVCTP